jgi:hypothetical protein
MRFEDEPYVRFYTRKTTTWTMLPWQAKCIAPLLLREVDRAGVLDLGPHGVRALAKTLDVPLEVVEPGLAGLVEFGVVEVHGDTLVWPRFIEGQTSGQSDRARKEASRGRARDIARRAGGQAQSVTNRDQESRIVTDGHDLGQKVTVGHSRSQLVTVGHSYLSCADLRDPPYPPQPPPEPEAVSHPEPTRAVPAPDPRRGVQQNSWSEFGAGWCQDYERCVRAETRGPWSLPPRDRAALAQVLAGFCLGPDANPAKVPAWIERTIREFVAVAKAKPGVWSGYAPSGLLRWLNSGKPAETGSSAGVPVPPPPPRFVPKPEQPANLAIAKATLAAMESVTDGHADSSAEAGSGTTRGGTRLPLGDPDEIGTSEGNVDRKPKRVGDAR